jgi:hypothetical protein
MESLLAIHIVRKEQKPNRWIAQNWVQIQAEGFLHNGSSTV